MRPRHSIRSSKEARGSRRRKWLVSAAIIGGLLSVSSAAFAYFSYTDNTNAVPAQAAAGTLGAPSGFGASAASSTSVTLAWTAPTNPAPTGWLLTQSSGSLSGSCASLAATTASCTASGLAPGVPYTWTLKALDGNWSSGSVQTGATLPKVTPVISGTASPSTVTVGGSVDDQATVSGGYNPSGTLTWSLYNNSSCTGTPLFSTSSGGAVTGDNTYTSGSYSPTGAGSDTWAISYNGDTSNNPVSTCGGSGQTLTVNKAAPAVSTVASVSVTVGSSVTDTATLSGGYNPTGTITYTLYGPSPTASCATQVGQVSSSVTGGNGQYTSPSIIPSQAGTYWWISNYGGDGNNNATANPCGVTGESSTVNKANVALATTATPSSVAAGGSVADQSVLSGGYNPTGTITWSLYSGSGCSGSAVFSTTTGGTVNGENTYTSNSYTPTAVGTYTWAVAYSGDTNNNTITAVCGGTGQTMTVTKAAPVLGSSGPTGGTAGTAIAATNISATLTGGYNHTGTITFTAFGPQTSAPSTCTSGGTAVGTAVTVTATTSTYNPTSGFTPTTAGNYWWYASYSGDPNNAAAASTCGSGMSETVVTYAPPSITMSGASGVTATAATMNASVNPEGDTDTVQFCYSTNSSAVTTSSCTGTKVTAGTSPATGTSTVNETYNLTGLTQATKYYYDLVVTSSGGAVYYGSPVQTFSTNGVLTITSVTRDSGNAKYDFSGTGTSGSTVTVHVCTTSSFPCSGGDAATATASASNGSYATGQDTNNLSPGTKYYIEATSTGPTQTSPVYSFVAPSSGAVTPTCVTGC